MDSAPRTYPSGSVVERAIEHYHSLLEGDSSSLEALNEAMARERLVFGDRPICSVLRPYFLSREENAWVQNSAEIVLGALHKAFAAVPESDYESLLGLTPEQATLARIEPGFSPVETIACLDSFWMRDGRIGFIEFNAESPGGVGFGSALSRIFLELPVMRRFAQRYELHTEPGLDHSLDALLAAYRAWGGTASPPNMAIVDWSGAKTYIEFEICRDAFRARGIPTEILAPEQLGYSGGRLRASDFEIDLVYRRLVASEIPQLGLDHPLVRAGRDRAVCLASALRALALTSKTMFALLSDPAEGAPLDRAERAALSEIVPWTRIVREGHTVDWNGQKADLFELALREREQLVVKPANEYGGVGVHLGWITDPQAWEEALKGALERPSVLQRRIPLPSEVFPSVATGRIEMLEFIADVDPYVFHGSAHEGSGTRLSRSQILNVTAGAGSAAPVFVITPRE